MARGTRAAFAGAAFVAACSTFSSSSDSPGADGGTTDAGAEAAAEAEADASDKPLCDGPAFRNLTLDFFNEDAPTTELIGGVLTATADNPDGGAGTGKARVSYLPPTNTYALELDYDLEMAGVSDVEIEGGCVLVLHHTDTPAAYTELYFVQQPLRTWFFKIDQTPAAAAFEPFGNNLDTLVEGTAQKKRAHLRVDFRNGRAAGQATWAGRPAKFDQALGRPIASMDVNCGLNFVDFKGKPVPNVSAKISSFTGYVCVP